MSLSRPSRSNGTPESERYYVGQHKPAVQRSWIPGDKHWYARRLAAQKLRVDEDLLADEPDLDPRIDFADKDDH